jgi:hypothetical protein
MHAWSWCLRKHVTDFAGDGVRDGGVVGMRVIVGMGLEVGVGVGRSRRGRLCDLRGVSELQQP